MNTPQEQFLEAENTSILFNDRAKDNSTILEKVKLACRKNQFRSLELFPRDPTEVQSLRCYFDNDEDMYNYRKIYSDKSLRSELLNYLHSPTSIETLPLKSVIQENLLMILTNCFYLFDETEKKTLCRILDQFIYEDALKHESPLDGFRFYLYKDKTIYQRCITSACQAKNTDSLDYLLSLFLSVCDRELKSKTGVCYLRPILDNLLFSTTNVDHHILETFLQISYRYVRITIEFNPDITSQFDTNTLAILIAYQVIDSKSMCPDWLSNYIDQIPTKIRTDKFQKYDPSPYVPLIKRIMSEKKMNLNALVKIIAHFSLTSKNIIEASLEILLPEDKDFNLTVCDLKTLEALVDIHKYKMLFIKSFPNLFAIHKKDAKELVVISLKKIGSLDHLEKFLIENPDIMNQIYQSVIEKFDAAGVDYSPLEPYSEILVRARSIRREVDCLRAIFWKQPINFARFLNLFKHWNAEYALITYPAVAQYILGIDPIQFFKYLKLALQVTGLNHPSFISNILSLILKEGKPQFLNEFIKVVQANKHVIPMTSENNILCSDLQACIFLVHGIQNPIISKYTPDSKFTTLIQNSNFDPFQITTEMGIAAYFEMINEISATFVKCTDPVQVAFELVNKCFDPKESRLLRLDHSPTDIICARNLKAFFTKPEHKVLIDPIITTITSNLTNSKEYFAPGFRELAVFILSPVFDVMAHAFIVRDNSGALLENIPSNFPSNIESYRVFENAIRSSNPELIQKCMDEYRFDSETYHKILKIVSGLDNSLELLHLLLPKIRQLNLTIRISGFDKFDQDIAVLLLSEEVLFQYSSHFKYASEINLSLINQDVPKNGLTCTNKHNVLNDLICLNKYIVLNDLIRLNKYIVRAIQTSKPTTSFELAIAIINELISDVTYPLQREQKDFNKLKLLLWNNYEDTLINFAANYKSYIKYDADRVREDSYYNSCISIIASHFFQKLLGKLQQKYSLEMGITIDELKEKNCYFADATLSDPSPQKCENFIADIQSDRLNFDNITLLQITQSPLPISKQVEIIGLSLQKNKYDPTKPLEIQHMNSESLATLFQYVQNNRSAHEYLSIYFVLHFAAIYSNTAYKRISQLLKLFIDKTDDICVTYDDQILNEIYKALFEKFGDPTPDNPRKDMLEVCGMPQNFAQFERAIKDPKQIASSPSVYHYFIKYDAYALFAHYLRIMLNKDTKIFDGSLAFMGIRHIYGPTILDANNFFKLIVDAKAHKCLQTLLVALKDCNINLGVFLTMPLSDIQKMIFLVNSYQVTQNDVYKANSFRSMVTCENALNPSIELGITAFQYVMNDTSPDFTNCTNWKEIAIALLEAYKKPSVGLFFTYDRNQLKRADELITHLRNYEGEVLNQESITFIKSQLKALDDFKTYSALLVFLISPVLRVMTDALIIKHNPSIIIEAIDTFDTPQIYIESDVSLTIAPRAKEPGNLDFYNNL